MIVEKITRAAALKPHPAAIALEASPGWRKIILNCPECEFSWLAPADRWGEPDIAICSERILSCPHCGTTTQLIVTE